MTDQLLKQQVHDYVESIWEDAVADIATLVAIRSVEDLDHAEKGKPYGPKPYEALSEAVRIASRLGLDAHNLDGHIGYADVPGASDRQLAMIAHTNIVPEGPIEDGRAIDRFTDAFGIHMGIYFKSSGLCFK